jgi:amino acid adenylation domain-containing protein
MNRTDIHDIQAPASATGADPEHILRGEPVALSYSAFGEAFEAMAKAMPDNIAVIAAGEELSYSALNTYANRVASNILDLVPEGKNAGIGVLMKRGRDLLPVLLGIIKAGCYYVPLDQELPEERIRYIARDSGIDLLITDTGMELPDLPRLIRPAEITISGVSDKDPFIITDPERLMYVTYTSGSTGNPKGVMVRHRNVLAFAPNLSRTFGIERGERFLALTNISFDISVLELLCTLLNGNTVVLAGEEELAMPSCMRALVEEKSVSAVQLTPSRLKVFIEIFGTGFFGKMNTLLIGGEELSGDLFEAARKLCSKVFNVYGPTETTIWSTAAGLGQGALSIGKPLPGERVLIINPHGQILPFGTEGEICIGGTGVSAGYLNNSALTAEKFIHIAGQEGIFYRTGDLGVILDGSLHFRGRLDGQVKLRGFRIETGEIEAVLRQVPEITDAVVALKELSPGYPELVAYYRSPEEIGEEALIGLLAEKLPYYMIPACFKRLEQFPQTSGGKLDRKALPLP